MARTRRERKDRNMRLRTVGLVVTLALGLLAPLVSDAQPPGRTARIGRLSVSSASVSMPNDEAFLQGLKVDVILASAIAGGPSPQ